MAESKTPAKTETTATKGGVRVVAEHVGGIFTERILTKKDQDKLVGTDGVGIKDLVWPAGSNSKLDITDVHEDVLDYIKKSDEWRVREVEVPAAS